MTILKIVNLAALSALCISCGGNPGHPIESAVFRNNTKELLQLIDAGFDVSDAVNDRGQTALHVACYHGKPEAAKVLIEAGADVTAHDNRNRTPWAAIFEKSPSQKGAFRSDEAEVLVLLLESGFKPGLDRDADGRTLLHQLAERCDKSGLLAAAVEALSLPVDIRDDSGWTPLHVAAREGRWGACEDLLNAGANANAETQSTVRKSATKGFSTTVDRLRYETGSRPLDLVSDHGTRYRSGVGELLKERGGTRNPAINNDVYN